MESSFRPMTCKNKKKHRWIVGFEGFWAWTSLPNVGGSSVKEKPFTLRTLLRGMQLGSCPAWGGVTSNLFNSLRISCSAFYLLINFKPPERQERIK